MRAAYLGPPGTNSHAALVAAHGEWDAVALPSVPAVVRAVQEGAAERGLVPVENSREGGVGATLDALVFDAPDVVVVGELVHRVTYCLAAGEAMVPDEVRTVHSHPQATGQCARFLAAQLPAAAVVHAPSTAEAVRAVAAGDALAGDPPHAAIGTHHAVRLYGAALLAEGIEDDPDNATRFAWLARRGEERASGAPPPADSAAPHADSAAPQAGGSGGRGSAGPLTKTALVFWGAGDLAPGWLVACLTEFSGRGLNLTRIESRPRRVGLGHYMFVCDVVHAAGDGAVAEAITGLRDHCEVVRVLGSFPAAA
jgi:prephenate dehydratase